MFKRRIFKLKFKKAYQHIPGKIGVWKEITDSSLISTLLSLQEKYNFEIVSTKFKNCMDYSYIKIKCNKEDRYKIFGEYCAILDGVITDISL